MTHVHNSSLTYPTRLSYIFMSLWNVIIKEKDVLWPFVFPLRILLSNYCPINPTYVRTLRTHLATMSVDAFLQPICVTFRQDQRAFLFFFFMFQWITNLPAFVSFSFIYKEVKEGGGMRKLNERGA